MWEAPTQSQKRHKKERSWNATVNFDSIQNSILAHGTEGANFPPHARQACPWSCNSSHTSIQLYRYPESDSAMDQLGLFSWNQKRSLECVLSQNLKRSITGIHGTAPVFLYHSEAWLQTSTLVFCWRYITALMILISSHVNDIKTYSCS